MFKTFHMFFIAVAGMLAAVAHYDAGLGWWLVAVVTYFAFGCLGVTVTFHRYVTHRSFEFRWVWLEKLFILIGTLAGTGSPIGWAAIHKAHHAHSDTEDDPHGPHLGWRHFIPDYDSHVDYMRVRSLMRDRYLVWLHNHAGHLIAAYWVALWLVGGEMLLAFAGLIPQALTSIFSVLCNYFPHKTGYRNHEIGDDSHNTWWLAIPTWGDAWHNNHHAKPWRASFSERWWELDISGLVISLISKHGTMK